MTFGICIEGYIKVKDWISIHALIYRFNAIPVNIPVAFFFWAEIDKLILKFIWKYKGPKVIKRILEKNKLEGLSFPSFES